MKNIILILSIFVTLPISAQIIYSTNNQYAADILVYVTNNQYAADLIVFKCDSKFSVTKNEGLWHFTDNKYSADKVIYFTDNKYAADLIIYITSNAYASGWKDSSKIHYMY
jgi:hypothetical protein